MNKSREHYPHLSDKAFDALSLSQAGRIQYITKDRWIPYAEATNIMDQLYGFITKDKTVRNPGMLILAQPNNGKSSLIAKFLERHPPSDDPDGESIRVNILLVNTPNTPSLIKFYQAILDQLKISYNLNHGEGQLQHQLYAVLRSIKVSIIAVDEINQVLTGTPKQQISFLNSLKQFGNELGIAVVCLGSQNAEFAFRTDESLLTRFPITVIPRWEYGPTFKKLLVSFEKVLPLHNPSNLSETKLAQLIHNKSGETIGDITKFMHSAAIYAVQHGNERIDEDAIYNCGFKTAHQRLNDLKLL